VWEPGPGRFLHDDCLNIVLFCEESECGSQDLDVASMMIVDERNGRTFNGALGHRSHGGSNQRRTIIEMV
jgi:hypothetical protein